jgi:hypothetical protein
MFGYNVVWVDFKAAQQDRKVRPLTLKERLERQSQPKQPGHGGLDVITPLHKPVLVRER